MEDSNISKNEDQTEENDKFLKPNLPISSNKCSTKKQGETDLPYTEPIWARTPIINQDTYNIEVVKNGTIIENIPLHEKEAKKSYLAIGRFDPCDIKLEHPSVSRFHAILQYGELTRGKPQWFIFDLNSTHGVRLNKTPIKKNSFVPLDPGHVFQIAGSSRIFVLSGGPEPKEDEGKAEKSESESKKIEETKNIEATKNENDEQQEAEEKHRFYEKDPLHWLEQYFEREGMPMEFKFTQTADGSGLGLMSKKKAKQEGEAVESSNWICSIELVSDVSLSGGTMVTATAPGKRLAQIQCALLACERLDEACLLQISSLWNKRKNYAENDFYEEDEDTFYDRTGQIEDQREKRKRRYEHDSAENAKAKTYADLVKEVDEVDQKLAVIKSEIDRMAGKDKYSENGEEKPALNFSTRMAISQMKTKEKKLLEEKSRLTKLCAIAKPSHTGFSMPAAPIKFEAKLEEEKIEEEKSERRDEEIPVKKEKIEEKDERKRKLNEPMPSTSSVESSESTKIAEEKTDVVEERFYAPAMPSRDEAKTFAPKFGILTREELMKMKMMQRHLDKEKEEREGRRMGRGANEAKMQQEEEEQIYYGSTEKYSTWMPPDDQKGDGSTRLNQKFAGKY